MKINNSNYIEILANFSTGKNGGSFYVDDSDLESYDYEYYITLLNHKVIKDNQIEILLSKVLNIHIRRIEIEEICTTLYKKYFLKREHLIAILPYVHTNVIASYICNNKLSQEQIITLWDNSRYEVRASILSLYTLEENIIKYIIFSLLSKKVSEHKRLLKYLQKYQRLTDKQRQLLILL